MKKLLPILALAAAGLAAFGGVQSADLKTGTSSFRAILSKDAAATPVEVRVANAYPASGNLVLKTVHVNAAGTHVTNTLATVAIPVGGATNATLNVGYVLRGDPLIGEFSAATNATVTVVSDIKL